MKAEPNTIYVQPPDKQMIVKDGELRLMPRADLWIALPLRAFDTQYLHALRRLTSLPKNHLPILRDAGESLIQTFDAICDWALLRYHFCEKQ